MRVAWLLVACTGCDMLFGLDTLVVPIDGRVDGPTDVPIDVVLANHDEDSDTIDDAIDKCPGIADPAQPDSDGDGVGDRCDPHPDHPIDRIYYFDTFDTMSPRWVTVQGTWAVDGAGHMVQSDPVLATNQLLVLEPTILLDAPTIEVILADIGEIDAGGYLITGGGGALPAGVACYVDDRSNNNSLVFFENRANETVAGHVANLLGNGFPLRITAISSGGDGTGSPLCTAQRADGAAPTAVSNPSTTRGITAATVGLYAYQATARYRSITVYVRR